MTGGYIELVAFMLLIPAIVFLGRAIGRRTEAARWATQAAAAAGIAYVALTVGRGSHRERLHCGALSTASPSRPRSW